jgi:hypothetical protein
MRISPRLSAAISPQQAEGVAAAERHEADVAAEALEAAVDRTGTRPQHLGESGDQLRALSQEREKVLFFWG